ncbi:MAG: hypothetical protein A2748_03435 [Candidatus Wildermuthbacteria bacterium RIFCSPHIGHO2_01_FULL_45_20]|nr:MAG: hypothetical protein A2748_03435 [Candidatus Wildermuthbacteria bacterium RIFCSPHIGHO2_01_FULL_45_20]
MKILYLITKSEYGGAQTHVAQIMKRMKAQGHTVALMTTPGGWLEEETKKAGISVYPNIWFSRRSLPWNLWMAIKGIQNTIQDFDPQLVHCHSTKAGFLGRLCIRNRIPTLYTAHGWPFAKGTPIIKKVAGIFAEKIASSFCSAIICVSRYDDKLAKQFRIMDKERLYVIYNGVQIPVLHGMYTMNSTMRVIFVGRMEKQKDQQLLLEAVCLLPKDIRSQIEIVFIGDGRNKKRLEAYVRKKGIPNVRFAGIQGRGAITEFMSKSNVLVLLSKWEGLPYALLEGMAVGLPVIASVVGGVSEVITKDCGFLVDKGNAFQVAEILELLMNKPELRKALGQNARKRIGTNFSEDLMFDQTKAIYQKLVKH